MVNKKGQVEVITDEGRRCPVSVHHFQRSVRTSSDLTCPMHRSPLATTRICHMYGIASDLQIMQPIESSTAMHAFCSACDFDPHSILHPWILDVASPSEYACATHERYRLATSGSFISIIFMRDHQASSEQYMPRLSCRLFAAHAMMMHLPLDPHTSRRPECTHTGPRDHPS